MHDRPHDPMDRRRFLSGSLAGLAATGTALSARPAAADARTTPSGLSFAVITDTHANVDEPDRTDWLARTFSSIQASRPAFVLNCGDITEYGGDGEYDAYLGTIPRSLRARVKHVPGNHEVRWDVHGMELYRRLFGPTPFSFDIGGLHVAGLDPTQLLQEPGHFGREHLRWLERDLAWAGRKPSLLFLHYPLGAEHYYVNDQDEVLAALADSPVRAVFAGHIHRQQVVRMNGFTQVAADDAKSGPRYYRVERGMDAGHGVLRVTYVALADDGGEAATDVTEIPLSGDGEAHPLRPVRIDVAGSETGRPAVHVRLSPDAQVASVRAQLYPQHVFGGGTQGSWVDLVPGGDGEWTGQVDLTSAPPGAHRMQVRVTDESDARYDATAPFDLPGKPGLPSVRWRTRLPGSIQGALAVHEGSVVVGTTEGRVEAFRPTAHGRRVRWARKLGPVYRAAAFDGSGRTVFVPSADHHLHALHAGNGASRWRFRTPEPVLSTPRVSVVGGDEHVFVTAGTRLYAVGAQDGRQRWSADLHGFFAGRVACDGTRVYTGGGDGNAYAFDAATGEELWSFSTTSRDTAYIRLIYGPWDDVVELLPDGRVLVSTVTHAFALDRTTGEQAWAAPGSHVYAPARLSDANVLLIDEWGKAQLVDTATGQALWQAELPDRNRVLNAGPVLAGGTAWVVSATGMLASIDLASGSPGHYRQLGPAQTFSTPVIVDGMLLTGDQDGVLQAIALPSAG